MNSRPELPARLTFGRFCLLPHRRELLRDDQPIKLGSRAFDVLMALIEAGGAVVSRNALMARIWPGLVVQESNLEVQISALRAAFRDHRGLIRTVSRRGYQFTGEIRFPTENAEDHVGAGAGSARPEAPLPSTNLLEPVSQLIGREDMVGEILNLAVAHRLITLTGTGGIGKTRVALALGRRLRPHFADGVWLAEFSPLSDPRLIPATVAATVGIDLGGDEISAPRVAQMLAGRELLLVMNTCEHVIDAAAELAEAVLRGSSALRIIATSREPLEVEGEWIYLVPPLAVPSEDSADDILRYGATQLFVERARAADPRFAPNRRSAGIISAICRRLDGIPLAIELAAALVSTLGIEELAVRLDDRFKLLTGGRRTGLPRHQTLRATLDWSYELLAQPERILLCRLAIFAGPFSLEAASKVAASAELAGSDVIVRISSLIAKSIVVAEVEGAARYRLLDTTRAYALEKLGEGGERARIARRHAEFYRDLFERADAEREARPTAEWIGVYGWRIGNLRAALDWAFSADGDASIGVALTADAVPLWMHLSLVDECRARVEQALSSLASSPHRDARREMQLNAALGASLIYMRGPTAEVGLVWTNALENAERLGDIVYQLRALRGLWAYRLENGEVRASLTLAQWCSSLTAEQGTSADLLVAERMIGTSLHYLGDQTNARKHIEGALGGYITGAPRPQLGYQFDQPVIVRAMLARILWLQGFPDQALRHALTSVEEAQAIEHMFSLCNALVQAACLVALWVGDLPMAERSITMLLDYSGRHGLESWHLRGRRYQAILMTKTGDPAAGLGVLRAALEGLRQSPKHGRLHHAAFLGAFAEALGAAGQVAEGLVAIDEALALAESTELHVSMPELQRVKGELLRLQGEPDVTTAEGLFRQALDLARRQGALSYELRAAMSLARQRSDQGRPGDGLACLQPVYDRFTEGFDTADLKSAKALLDTLR